MTEVREINARCDECDTEMEDRQSRKGNRRWLQCPICGYQIPRA